jgi:hypothetical protein
VNRQEVRTVEGLRTELRRASSRPVLVLINRRGHELFVTAGKLS